MKRFNFYPHCDKFPCALPFTRMRIAGNGNAERNLRECGWKIESKRLKNFQTALVGIINKGSNV
jgi:hypothetical protein